MTKLTSIIFQQGDWICLKCYHREQLRLVTANANMTMNMVGVNSKQSKDGRSIIEGGLKEESSYTATDLLEDINALNEPSISDEGVTPGSSINGAQSQPTTRSDSKKSMITFFYTYYGDLYFNDLKYHGLSLMTSFQI